MIKPGREIFGTFNQMGVVIDVEFSTDKHCHGHVPPLKEVIAIFPDKYVLSLDSIFVDVPLDACGTVVGVWPNHRASDLLTNGKP
ncbi:hypothetical protein BCAR13_890054 [Paraburkholderia caribensis]|nr:hypothetical protein BCAR13_890054 [Paraburkholderia caribensis]